VPAAEEMLDCVVCSSEQCRNDQAYIPVSVHGNISSALEVCYENALYIDIDISNVAVNQSHVVFV